MHPELSPKLKLSAATSTSARKGGAVPLDDNTASDDGGSLHLVTSKVASLQRKSYPGGKSGAGVYQNIISIMPPHETYIEAFLGSGAIMRMKRPALRNIAIERDEDVLRRFDGEGLPNFHRMLGDAITILRGWHFCLPMPTDLETMKRTLVYADPPYLMSTRRQHRPLYRCELSSEDEHLALLEVLMNLPCMVMLSGYHSKLYDRALAHWRREEFYTSDRGGNRKLECVWLNFPEPLELHDYRYLGRGFRERERIKRKRLRWRARLESMPALERHALMATIDELRSSLAGNGDRHR